MFNQLQTPRYSSIVRKLCRILEDQPLPQLTGELQPSIVLESERPEWQYLGGTMLSVGCAYRTGAAGNYPHIMLRNPANSGVLCAVRRILVSVGAGAWIGAGFLEAESTALWTHGAEALRDPRNKSGSGTAVYSQNNASILVAVADRAQWVYVPAGPNDIIGNIVIPPNWAYCVYSTDQNKYVAATFEYQERALGPDEA